MELNFEIKNQILTRTDTQILVNKSNNYVFCNFLFKTEEWDTLNKFCIFKDSWGKSYTQHLGVENNCQCKVPAEVLQGTFFKISVYAGNLITSTEITVILVPSGYTTSFNEHSSSSEKDIFVELFEELSTKIDNVIFDDGFLRCYSGDELISEVQLVLEDEAITNLNNRVDSKADKNHTHNSQDIVDLSEVTSSDIDNDFDLFCTELANRIRMED